MIKIAENLFQGDLNDALRTSAEKTVDVIVYLGQGMPDKLAYGDVPVIHIPLKDGKDLELKINIIFSSIGLSNLKLQQKTLVACRAGLSRSPIIIAGFLGIVKYNHPSFSKGFKEMKKLIPNCMPHPDLLENIKKFVENYEERKK